MLVYVHRYHIAGVALFFLSWIGGRCDAQAMTVMHQLTLLGSQSTWNDASEYCQANDNGVLVGDKSLSHSIVLKRFVETEWSNVWNGTRAWLGLFIEDITAPLYTWAHNCQSLNLASYNRFPFGIPPPDDIDPEKQCMYKDFTDGTWVMDDCRLRLNAVCINALGPCIFERGTAQNVCLNDISEEDTVFAPTQTICEDLCFNMQDGSNGQCWAVTYIPAAQKCVPSISHDPYAFESGNNFTYEDPCNVPMIRNISEESSVVSWKRCFVDPLYDEEPIPNTYLAELDPVVQSCVPGPLPTVPTPEPPPIPPPGPLPNATGLGLSYPPTFRKRRLILLTDRATFNDAAAFCHLKYNGTMITPDSKAIGQMAYTYRNNHWDAWQDTSVWNGISVSDLDGPKYKYQSNCSYVNVEAYHRFESIPEAGSLDPSQLCLRGDFITENWEFERCNATYSAMCEQIHGPCTFELDTSNDSCTIGFNVQASVKFTYLFECERYCLYLQPEVWGDGECWAVTYIPESGECIPSISEYPLLFNKGSNYQSPCLHDHVTSTSNNHSVVSWKRCFKEPPIYDTSDICDAITPTDDPTAWCTAAGQPPIVGTGNGECSGNEITSTQPTVETTPTTVQPIVTDVTTSFSTEATEITTTDSSHFTSATTTTFPSIIGGTPQTLAHIPDTTADSLQTTTGGDGETTTLLTGTDGETTTATTTQTISPDSTSTAIPLTTDFVAVSTATATTTNGTGTTVTKGPGEPSCSCTCVINANMTVEEKTLSLKKALTMNKDETSAHSRALTSAPDERPSAFGVGMTLGVGMLAGVTILVTLGDIISVSTFIYASLMK